jgi:hypothetical protein
MHRGPSDVHRGDGRQLLTAFGQGRIRLLLMELVDHTQIRLNLSGIPSPMPLGRNAARGSVPLQQRLDKA